MKSSKKKFNINKRFLIEISDSDEDAYNLSNDSDILSETNDSEDDNENDNKFINKKFRENMNMDENIDDDEDENNNKMYLICNENTDSDDPDISEFIQFCMKKGLFDNTFYDMHNSFSVVATKLPKTFEKLSKNGDDVKKRTFIHKFKKDFGYNGNINFIYNCLDEKKKGFITWDDFVDFFLPYIQYITM